MDRAKFFKDQARLLRDLAEASGQDREIRERMHKIARAHEDLADVLERSLEIGGSDTR